MKLLLILGAEESRISEDEREWLEMIVEREKPDGLVVQVARRSVAEGSSPFVSSLRSLVSDRGWKWAGAGGDLPDAVAILPSVDSEAAEWAEVFWSGRGAHILKPNWQSDYAKSSHKKKKK